MNRRKLILTALLLYPINLLAKINNNLSMFIEKGTRMRTKTGFKVNSGDARYGKRYKMKGVTLNNLDKKLVEMTLMEM